MFHNTLQKYQEFWSKPLKDIIDEVLSGDQQARSVFRRRLLNFDRYVLSPVAWQDLAHWKKSIQSRLTALSSSSSSVNINLTAEERWLLGCYYYLNNDVPQARDCFKQALNTVPEAAWSLAEIARWDNATHDDAINYYRQASEGGDSYSAYSLAEFLSVLGLDKTSLNLKPLPLDQAPNVDLDGHPLPIPGINNAININLLPIDDVEALNNGEQLLMNNDVEPLVGYPIEEAVENIIQDPVQNRNLSHLGVGNSQVILALYQDAELRFCPEALHHRIRVQVLSYSGDVGIASLNIDEITQYLSLAIQQGNLDALTIVARLCTTLATQTDEDIHIQKFIPLAALAYRLLISTLSGLLKIEEYRKGEYVFLLEEAKASLLKLFENYSHISDVVYHAAIVLRNPDMVISLNLLATDQTDIFIKFLNSDSWQIVSPLLDDVVRDKILRIQQENVRGRQAIVNNEGDFRSESLPSLPNSLAFLVSEYLANDGTYLDLVRHTARGVGSVISEPQKIAMDGSTSSISANLIINANNNLLEEKESVDSAAIRQSASSSVSSLGSRPITSAELKAREQHSRNAWLTLVEARAHVAKTKQSNDSPDNKKEPQKPPSPK